MVEVLISFHLVNSSNDSPVKVLVVYIVLHIAVT